VVLVLVLVLIGIPLSAGAEGRPENNMQARLDTGPDFEFHRQAAKSSIGSWCWIGVGLRRILGKRDAAMGATARPLDALRWFDGHGRCPLEPTTWAAGPRPWHCRQDDGAPANFSAWFTKGLRHRSGRVRWFGFIRPRSITETAHDRVSASPALIHSGRLQRGRAPMIGAAWRLLRDSALAWVDDYAPSMGAALAFYTLFSLAPLLLIVISVAGLVFGEDAARGAILGQLSGLVGEQSAATIEAVLASLNRPAAGVTGTVVGVAMLLVGATSVFGELQDALDRIWRAPKRTGNGLWALLRTRLLSLGLVLGIGFLLLVSLVLSAALAALDKWWAPWLAGWGLLAQVLNFAIGFVLVAAVFAMIYKWMPRQRVAWGDVAVGAVITALLFTVGKTLIGLYIGRSGVASPFGAAASLVVLLLWVYYSAQVFLLGAELTWVYSQRHGSLRGMVPDPASPAVAAPEVPRRAAAGQATEPLRR